jgi:hypothetical protein
MRPSDGSAYLEQRGWSDDVDIVLTTDHGEFQGDYGLSLKVRTTLTR